MLLLFYLPWLTIGGLPAGYSAAAFVSSRYIKAQLPKYLSLLGDPSMALPWPKCLNDQKIALLIL